jgi:hypothetical protein
MVCHVLVQLDPEFDPLVLGGIYFVVLSSQICDIFRYGLALTFDFALTLFLQFPAQETANLPFSKRFDTVPN